MASPTMNLIDQDVQIAWRRFRGNASAQEMLRWLNHEFRRGYRLDEFENSLRRVLASLQSGESRPSAA
jgi:hypothetical protein